MINALWLYYVLFLFLWMFYFINCLQFLNVFWCPDVQQSENTFVCVRKAFHASPNVYKRKSKEIHMESEPCGVDCFLLQVCLAHSALCTPRWALYLFVYPLLFSSHPLCSLLQKGAKEFVDQNMLRSQRSRRRRRQQRPTSSSCPGPSESPEEGKQGDSDHETTSSSGGSLISQEIGLELLLKAPSALSALARMTKGVTEKVQFLTFVVFIDFLFIVLRFAYSPLP